MNISINKILSIVLLSSLAGLLVNMLSDRGIPLIRQERELAWLSDSLANVIVAEHFAIKDTSDKIQSNSETISDTSKQQDRSVAGIIGEQDKPKEKDLTTTILAEPVKINLETAFKLYSNNVTFVDARPVEEFNEGHIRGAYNVPYYADDVDALLTKISVDQPVVVYCSGTDCDLSIMLGNKMFKMGYKNVFVFFGGWSEWQGKNYPTESPE